MNSINRPVAYLPSMSLDGHLHQARVVSGTATPIGAMQTPLNKMLSRAMQASPMYPLAMAPPPVSSSNSSAPLESNCYNHATGNHRSPGFPGETRHLEMNSSLMGDSKKQFSKALRKALQEDGHVKSQYPPRHPLTEGHHQIGVYTSQPDAEGDVDDYHFTRGPTAGSSNRHWTQKYADQAVQTAPTPRQVLEGYRLDSVYTVDPEETKEKYKNSPLEN